MTMSVEFDSPAVFEPLIDADGARYIGAYGGRGGCKSHFFAERLVEEALLSPGDRGGEGLRAVCVREVQRSLAASSKLLVQDKIRRLGLDSGRLGFRVYEDKIATPGDGVILFTGMQAHTAESVKSLEGFRIAWLDEAQAIAQVSLDLLRPTIMRIANAQIWASWNPTRKSDPIDRLFRGPEPPAGAVSVRTSWRDNPFRSPELDAEREDFLRSDPDAYPHVWEGEYATASKSAYFARQIAEARSDRRIGRVSADPLLPLRLFVDIGGTGARSDAFTIWVAQFVGREIRVLDYYEAVGQPMAAHVAWMREHKCTPDRAQVWLPHDGETHDKVVSVSYESAFRGVGYDVTVVTNQGTGAAKSRIESVRRVFPACFFNEDTTSAGIDALAWYHEKRDAKRGIGLGPSHDWSSHGADSFGLLAICAEQAFSHDSRRPESRDWRSRIRRINASSAQAA